VREFEGLAGRPRETSSALLRAFITRAYTLAYRRVSSMEAEFTYRMVGWRESRSPDTKYGVSFRQKSCPFIVSAWSRRCYGSIVAERSDSYDELLPQPQRRFVCIDSCAFVPEASMKAYLIDID
jgi:hypothetical protein